jgi:hypothetical protein
MIPSITTRPLGSLLLSVALLAATASARLLGSPSATDVSPAINIPTIIAISADGQIGIAGEFNAKPFDVAVWNATGTKPLAAIDVTFTVESGGGQLALTNTASAMLANSLTLKTDQDGTVQVYYKQPALAGISSQIKATAASGEITLHTTTLGLALTDSGDNSTGNGQGRTSSKSAKSKVTDGAGSSGVVGPLAGADASATTKSATNQPAVQAFTLPASLVVKTPKKGNYAVNTATWAIAPKAP